DDAVRRVLHDLVGHLLHDFVVHVQQIVTAHARLARHTRCDHHDVGVRALGIITGPHRPAVRSPDGTCFEHVQCDARRLLIRNVDDNHVGQLLVGNTSGNGGAHIACSTDYGYSSSHK